MRVGSLSATSGSRAPSLDAPLATMPLGSGRSATWSSAAAGGVGRHDERRADAAAAGRAEGGRRGRLGRVARLDAVRRALPAAQREQRQRGEAQPLLEHLGAAAAVVLDQRGLQRLVRAPGRLRQREHLPQEEHELVGHGGQRAEDGRESAEQPREAVARAAAADHRADAREQALLQRLGAAARDEHLGEEGGGDGGDGGRLGRARGPEELERRLVELARMQQRGEDRRRALEHLG